tara:strand:+ start:224 stop:412 length:189 start_codon:yes stop_codon:yes gene_type:complete
MNHKIPDKFFIFLNQEIGLSYSSIHLGIKLSIKNEIPLPMALWSYSLITTEELDRFYNFMWS